MLAIFSGAMLLCPPVRAAEFSQIDKLLGSDPQANQHTGMAVGIQGDTALISLPFEGKVEVYARSGNGWSFDSTIEKPPELLGFGGVLAFEGDLAAVAGYEDVGGTTHVVVLYRRRGGVWSKETTLKPSDSPQHSFGKSAGGMPISISGDTIVVGAFVADVNGIRTGAAYVFVRDSGEWIEQQKLVADPVVQGDNFGWSVAVSGDAIMVGAEQSVQNNMRHSGAVYAFERVAGRWTQTQVLLPEALTENANLGAGVAIEGDQALVGAYTDDEGGINAGAVWAYERVDGRWVEAQKLIASDSYDGAFFGNTIVIGDRYAVIGAPYYPLFGQGPETGAVYVYRREGSAWVEQQRLVGSDLGTRDEFGRAIGVTPGYVLVGAHQHTEPGLSRTGAAYLFFDPNLLPDAPVPDAGVVDTGTPSSSNGGGDSGCQCAKAVPMNDWSWFVLAAGVFTWLIRRRRGG